MPYERNFISIETKLSPETVFQSKEEITDFVIKNIPGYTEAQLNEPVGDEQTTLNKFLEKANNGSEWTDPHGFKINIAENKFRISTNSENKENNNEFLSNTAFQNFSSGFETYQKILESNLNKEEIAQKMHALYRILNSQERSEKIQELEEVMGFTPCGAKLKLEESAELINFALSNAENNKFNKEEFAKKLSSLSIREDFEKEWNNKGGDISGDLTMLNNVLAFRIEKDGDISLHIRPANIKANELLRNIKEGFKKLSEEMKNGDIRGNNIAMKSWLLNSDYEAVIERFFGKKLDFKNVPNDDQDVLPAQCLALQYNSKELEKYLKTGLMPKLRKIELTKDEILDKFSGSKA
jgi:hypothetical protein